MIHKKSRVNILGLSKRLTVLHRNLTDLAPAAAADVIMHG